MDIVEEKLRNLTIPQLEILKVLAYSDEILDSQEISKTTQTATTTFRAYIAALKKLKSSDGQSIVIPAGRTTDGTRWQLNEKVIERQRLKEILAEMQID